MASTVLVVPAQAVQHEVLVLQNRRFRAIVGGSGGRGCAQQVTFGGVLERQVGQVSVDEGSASNVCRMTRVLVFFIANDVCNFRVCFARTRDLIRSSRREQYNTRNDAIKPS